MNSLDESFASCLSIKGKKSVIASKIVTSEPSLDHTLPSSRPITPAPIIPRFSGTSSKFKAPVLSTTFSLQGAMGISIGDEPVAKITCSASKILSSSPEITET